MSESVIIKAVCLMCGQEHPTQGKVMGRHTVDTKQAGAQAVTAHSWLCIGSDHFPVRENDPHVETRRYAVQRYALADRSAVKLRSEMATALADKAQWKAASVINHYGTVLVLNEELAHLWHRMADEVDPFMVIKDALADLYPNWAGAPIEQATGDARSAAARQFLVEARRELERAFPGGWTADQVATVFFSL